MTLQTLRLQTYYVINIAEKADFLLRKSETGDFFGGL